MSNLANAAQEGLGAIKGLYDLAGSLAVRLGQPAGGEQVAAAVKRLQAAAKALDALSPDQWAQVRRVRGVELRAETVQAAGLSKATACDAVRTLTQQVTKLLAEVPDGKGWPELTLKAVGYRLPLGTDTDLQRLRAELDRELAAMADQPVEATELDDWERITQAVRLCVGGKNTPGVTRLIEIGDSDEKVQTKLSRMGKTGLLRANVSARELAKFLGVSHTAIKKTQWWRNRMAQRKTEEADDLARRQKKYSQPGRRGRRR